MTANQIILFIVFCKTLSVLVLLLKHLQLGQRKPTHKKISNWIACSQGCKLRIKTKTKQKQNP